jgi:hypothetical protein
MSGMHKKATMNERAERRKDKRFQVQDGAFAMLSLQLGVLGQIVNISREGLSFRYVASKARTTPLSTLNILLTDGSFSLKKVPVEPVWDHPIPLAHKQRSEPLQMEGRKALLPPG